ncbi:AAA family ATPase [Clostridium tertium]|uniref:Nuclease SbcCD subunit C n=1 Tax=Clostridium tertium TaxID=1559 RepID=A0A6N3FG73_9CLOT
MKIRRLKFCAFGPYAKEVDLDFDENLNNKNMFVITGNTGAGKTTIFDAINFALYGEASGSDRDGKAFRSDFADKATDTEVELWFSLKGKEYYIKRNPNYSRAKQRGEGFTEQKAGAEIKFEDKTITGAKEVTRLVEDILGITCDQFKQLVMIPQGEFKKLLNADSDKKEEIFRKIFGTKIFSDIQQNIKIEANNLKKIIETIQRDRENRIRAFLCREDDSDLSSLISNKDLNIDLILEGFYDSISKDEKDEDIIKENLQRVNKEINKLSKELALANDINKKLENLEAYKKEFNTLTLLKEEYKLKEENLSNGKKAVTALSYEDKYKEKKSYLSKNEKELSISNERLNNYKVSLKEAEKLFEIQVEKEPLKNELIKKLDEVESLKDKALNYEENKEKLNTYIFKANKIKTEIKKATENSEDNSKLIKSLNEELGNISIFKEKKNSLKIEELNLKSKLDKLYKLKDAIEKSLNEEQRHSKGAAYYEEANKEYLNKKENYEKLEDTFRRNQAGILAKSLKDGDPCPVCGSTNHPILAELESESITEVLVKESKSVSDLAYERREKYYRELTKIVTEITSLKEKYIKPLYKEIFLDDLNEETEDLLKIAKEAILEEEEKLNKLTNDLTLIEKELSKENKTILIKEEKEKSNEILKINIEKFNNELLEVEGEVKTQEANLNNILKDFKGEFRTVTALDKEKLELNKALNDLIEDYKKAEKYYKDSKSNYDKENGNKISLESLVKSNKEDLDKAIEEFKDKVLALGFKNYNDYAEKRITEEEIEVLEKDINNYNIKLSNAERVYNLALEETKDSEVQDVNSINEGLNIKNTEKEKIEKVEKEIYYRINQNKKIISECLNYNKLIKNDEEKYKVVGKLAKIINGDNPRKISFERYVLAAYFEDIITSANLRFTQMTNNRFELLRKEDLGDKRKGQGLDLEVFDNYTGKARDVKTLSGGEAFKASLSMALGLADVVQRYSGGIQLDTMFIDEGFGTLDPDSLDNAIECLVNLQNDGRVVGIISHVQELKDRIEVKLEVASTNKGSTAVFKK